jgi:uncharacterized membrane protein
MAWLAIGVVTGLAQQLERRLYLHAAALVVLSFSACAWLFAHASPEWMTPGETWAGLHPAGAIAAALAGMAWAVAHRPGPEAPARRVLATGALVGATLLVLTATSFEAARLAAAWTSGATARAAAVSLWWGAFGAAILVIGVRTRSSVARFGGLGLILLGAAKAAIVDLADVAPAWRVASFVGLGLLMLAVAVGYSRLAGKKTGRGA